jgi:hypothetical protein
VARPSFQLAAGLLVLAGLLGLSTALIAEVREEVLDASEEAEGAPAREVREAARGLPVPQITLLDPTTATVPERAPTDRGFRAEAAGLLRLEEGEAIEPGSMQLPAEAQDELGEGWETDAD